jgi:hypothetical protein
MSLSNLNQVLLGSLPAYSVYQPAPTSSYSNPSNPESEVSFIILGYLVSNPNIMLFQVTASINTSSTLSVNTNTTADAISVSDTTGLNRQQQSNYYTVDFGTNTTTAWTLTFNITLKDGSTGSWVFTKKGVGEDEVAYN